MIFKEHENEKKRKYQQRILDVKMGTSTPLVFATNGGMGIDGQMLLKQLAVKLCMVITWFKTRMSFEILKQYT